MTVRLEIEYDGREFRGWAAQPRTRSVHGELRRALTTILRTPITLTVAGRTDRGVHAVAQVASYDGPVPDLYSLNAVLPRDVAVRSAVEVAGFDARRLAISRTYCFRLVTRRRPAPLERHGALWWPHALDDGLLARCADALVGTHDFTAFTPTETAHVLFRRAVARAQWSRVGDRLEFWVEGQSFLRHMNRVLVGTMLQVGSGRLSIDAFRDLLEGAPREAAGPTLPPHGLYLAGVGYAAEHGGPAVAPAEWGAPPWAGETSRVDGATDRPGATPGDGAVHRLESA